MPDIASTRYELCDSPLFKAKMKELFSFDNEMIGRSIGESLVDHA